MDIVNHDMRTLELVTRLTLAEQRYDANRRAVVLLVCLLLPVISVNPVIFHGVKEVALSLIDSGVVHMSVFFFFFAVLLWPTACTPPPKAL